MFTAMSSSQEIWFHWRVQEFGVQHPWSFTHTRVPVGLEEGPLWIGVLDIQEDSSGPTNRMHSFWWEMIVLKLRSACRTRWSLGYGMCSTIECAAPPAHVYCPNHHTYTKGVGLQLPSPPDRTDGIQQKPVTPILQRCVNPCQISKELSKVPNLFGG